MISTPAPLYHRSTSFLLLDLCGDHADSSPGMDAEKKPAKKPFRVLAGIYDKPKRLFTTF